MTDGAPANRRGVKKPMRPDHMFLRLFGGESA